MFKLLGRTATKSSLVKMVSATPHKTVSEAMEAIGSAERRGYDAESKTGPRSASFFVSVVQDYWRDRSRREPPPTARDAGLPRAEFERMADAFDPLEDAA